MSVSNSNLKLLEVLPSSKYCGELTKMGFCVDRFGFATLWGSVVSGSLLRVRVSLCSEG